MQYWMNLFGFIGIGVILCMSMVRSEDDSVTTGPWGLTLDPSIGLVISTCGQCHTPLLLTHHHRSREAWKDTLIKMESNGMPPLTNVTRTMLLDYLEKHQGPLKEERSVSSPWGQAAFHANPLWD